MSILSDNGIKASMRAGLLKIEPFDEKYLQPASYDFHLAEGILVPKPPDGGYVVPDETDGVEYWRESLLPRVLYPGDVVLGSTIERFTFPSNLVGRLEGVSTLGRWFLSVHITAGFFDPAFEGKATLEIKNQGPFKIMLRPGMRAGQMSFETLESYPTKKYGWNNRYQGQVAATPPRRSPGVS